MTKVTVDWSQAPEGATHYHIGDRCAHNWLKQEGDRHYFHNGEEWRQYPYPMTQACMKDFLLTEKRPSLFPESGTTCEVLLENGVWCECLILGMDSQGYCVHEVLHSKVYEGENDPQNFRPIVKKRTEALEALVAKGLSMKHAQLAYEHLVAA